MPLKPRRAANLPKDSAPLRNLMAILGSSSFPPASRGKTTKVPQTLQQVKSLTTSTSSAKSEGLQSNILRFMSTGQRKTTKPYADVSLEMGLVVCAQCGALELPERTNLGETVTTDTESRYGCDGDALGECCKGSASGQARGRACTSKRSDQRCTIFLLPSPAQAPPPITKQEAPTPSSRASPRDASRPSRAP